MGILINTGFDVGSSSPIDNRTIKNTIDERDTLVSEGKVYENLKVYCKDTKKEYRWTGTEWETLSGNSSEITYDTLETTDKTIVGAINEVNGNSLDTVGFSADYKNIILNRKNGLNPYTIPISAIINNAKLIELGDVDSTDIGNGKILAYDSATNKHKYVDSSITDELVKMDGITEAKYLGDLLDKSTIVNENGILKVKKLDGQEVTITEINYLKGLTMNVMDLVNAFANGGVKVLNTPLNTVSELDTMDRTSFIDGISYIVYVLADENHSGAKTTYLVDKTNTTFFGNADSQRNFTTNPIDLANEITGKLGTSNIDVDGLWTLLTINDTYKTLTTNNEVFGTHGAKAMYDELTTAIGEKANASDLTTHTNDTDIHVTTTDKAKWNKVDEKVDKTSITTTIDSTSTDTQVPSAKSIYSHTNNSIVHMTQDEKDKIINKGTYNGASLDDIPYENLYTSIYDVRYNITQTPTNYHGVLICKYFNEDFCIQVFISLAKNIHIRSKMNGIWSTWRKVCTTSVEDIPVTDLTWADTTHFEVSFTGLNYQVKNGVCFVNIDMTCNSPINEGYKLPITLPTPNTEYVHHRVSSFQQRSSITIAVGNSGTDVIAYGGLKGDRYLGTFSYPVAES